MITVPASFIPPYLRAVGANEAFVSAEGAHRRVRERALRPRPFGPPPRLRPRVRIAARRVHRWPVYTLTPPQRDPAGSVVYVHGGGWVNEIATQHWRLAAQICAEANMEVVVPIYPLVPFGTATQALDGVTSLLLDQHHTFRRVAVAGDSAGGQIALSAALALRDQGVRLDTTVLISPALDLSFGNPEIPRVQPHDPWLAVPGGRVLADLWAGDRAIDDPAVSPLAGELAGLGPITVFTGTHDVLNPDARQFGIKARAAGVDLGWQEVDGQVHVYPLLPTRAGAAARASMVATFRHVAAERSTA